MLRRAIPFLLTLALGLTAFAATTVVIDGKTVTVPVIEKGGKAYVDVATLMKLLGGKASFDAAAHKVVISKTNQAPASAGGGSTGGSAGTAQLPGDNGELGKVYAMAKSYPLYFSLKSAEYTTGRVRIGESIYAPKAEEKMLVLHFTVQNPQKEDRFIRWDSLKIMVVDAMNVNHEPASDWGDEESHNSVGLSLKPAQKIAVYMAIMVPAKGDVPKLMIQPTDDGPVLRYDLRGKVTTLTEPFADPADTSGLTARELVPAQLGTAYPYFNFDITVEKSEYTTNALEDEAPSEDGRFFVITALIKNQAASDQFLRWDTIQPVLTTTDGEECNYRNMLFATSNRAIGQNLKAGQEMRVRLYFDVAKDAAAGKLTIKENESRMYEYAIPK